MKEWWLVRQNATCTGLQLMGIFENPVTPRLTIYRHLE
jgi:hypothetical protein